MKEITKKDKTVAHILFVGLVCIWGFDYIVAKAALETLEPLSLLNMKYTVGFMLLLFIKLVAERKVRIRLKDIPFFVLCSIFGEIIYFYCEYSALDYMPIALVTIMLAFVPGISIMIEWAVFKKKPTRKMIAGVLVCVMGIALIIGVDVKILLTGRMFGYILCFIAILSWNAYNFVTASLTEKYPSITLTATQLLCTILLTLPYAIHNFPGVEALSAPVVGGVIYLGIASAGIGFLISVTGIRVLGPTTAALYSNFLPVTSAIFGWVFLKESLSLVQIVGGIIVISAGYMVIKEKGKLEEKLDEREA